MSARQWGVSVAVAATLVAASGCSLLPSNAGGLGVNIDVRQSAYAAFYADSLSREAGFSTVRADGSVIASQQLSALGLEHRADSPAAVVLVGERAADLVVVGSDGTLRVAELAFAEGSGATAITWLGDGNLATMVNVGNTEHGYSNPLVIHDVTGAVRSSLPLQGYFSFVGESAGRIVVAGERAIHGMGDGSRVVLIDRSTMSVAKTFDWADAGGLQSCTLLVERLICLETGAYHEELPPENLANNVVVIDLDTGRKSKVTTLPGDGIRAVAFDGKVYLATYEALSLLADDLQRVTLTIPLAAGAEQIEQVSAGAAGIDVFVRDFDRVKLPDGRVDIGHVVRLDPRSLQVTRQTPVQLPDQQLVGVHFVAREFFTQR